MRTRRSSDRLAAVRSRRQSKKTRAPDAESTNRLARAFNRIAENYDRLRPGYPTALIDDVITIAKIPREARILEIGSGTGKATILFARRGFDITAIEPSRHMVAVARRNLVTFPKVRIQRARFEDVRLDPATYDLVIAAQSFHWINQTEKYFKSAFALKPSSWLAVFWNCMRPNDTALSRDLNAVLQSHLPQYAPLSESTYEHQILNDIFELHACGRFTEFHLRRYPVQLAIGLKTTENFIASLTTWSQVAALSHAARSRLVTDLRELLSGADVDAVGEREAILVVARKKSNKS